MQGLKRTSKLLILFLISGLTFAPQAMAEEQINEFMSALGEAYGGTKNLLAAKGLRQHGTIVSKQRGDLEGLTDRYLLGTDKLRVDIRYPEQPEISRVVDGLEGWKDGSEAPDMLTEAMRLQAARLAIPRLLFERPEIVVDLGENQSPSGKIWRVLRVDVTDLQTIFLQIDPQSHLIIWSRGVISHPQMGQMEFATGYQDFKTFDGILLATREENYAMRQHIGHTIINEAIWDNKIPLQTFRPKAIKQ